MNAACSALQLFLAAVWLFQDCATTILPRYANKTERAMGRTKRVLGFQEVFSRSVCQVKETMVSVNDEYPDLFFENIVVPSCVALKRCVGCCRDELTKCVTLRTRTVSMEVLLVNTRTQQSKSSHLTFKEHTKCECRTSTSRRSAEPSPPCAPCPRKKKLLDPQTCQCVCKRDSMHCEERGWGLNNITCKCMNRKAKKTV